MVGVSQDFRLRSILLRPVPLLVEFLREREGILHALDVAARAGITVPIPSAADAAAGLIDPRGEAEAAQAVQHVHAGKTGADNDRVEYRVGFRRKLLLILLARSHGSIGPGEGGSCAYHRAKARGPSIAPPH